MIVVIVSSPVVGAEPASVDATDYLDLPKADCGFQAAIDAAVDARLRREFFPDAKQSHTLNYAVVRAGKVVSRRSLLVSKEGESNQIPGRGRFQVTPEGRLFVFCYVSGSDAAGNGISEDRIMELYRNGGISPWVKVPMKHPMSDYFTATVRAGSPPSRFLELLGHRAGKPATISYARIRLDYLSRHGMVGTDFDACLHNWATHGLNYYVLAKLLWNPDADVDALIDEYCRSGFGPRHAERQHELLAFLRSNPRDSRLPDGRLIAGDRGGGG